MNEEENFDFAGFAITTDTVCSDGLSMAENAFAHQDGDTVPLVWGHTSKKTPKSILGTALLKNVKGGVRAYCTFNHTDEAQHAKEAVNHRDITDLSAWGYNCDKVGNRIVRGAIKEVSLVLKGADPKAKIDTACFAHSDEFIETFDGEFDNNAIFYLGTIDTTDFSHADDSKTEPEAKKSSDKDPDKEIDVAKEFENVMNKLSEEEQTIVYAVIGAASKPDALKEGEEVKHEDDNDDNEFVHGMEEDDMQRNVFENNKTEPVFEFTHEDQRKVIQMAVDGSRSLRETIKEYLRDNAPDEFKHDDDPRAYGIGHIEWLFPDYKNVENTPEFIKRPDDWVSVVMNGVHHVPFSRIKSMAADITEDEARALGYIKGDEKLTEFFDLIKRTTDPQTIYKLQELDNDDIHDITDFDVVAWLKLEMRMMLNEEIARAILVGDGRAANNRQKIQEAHVRSVLNDDPLYSMKYLITYAADATDDEKSRAYIRGIIKSRKGYRGKGSPVMFCKEDVLTDMLLIEDSTGRIIYDSVDKLKNMLRVSAIYTVPVMETSKYTVKTTDDHDTLGPAGTEHDVVAIILNLDDYYVGADKGGSVQMFDDFDIKFNQHYYLIETRMSGALVHPKSAITVMSSVEDDG